MFLVSPLEVVANTVIGSIVVIGKQPEREREREREQWSRIVVVLLSFLWGFLSLLLIIAGVLHSIYIYIYCLQVKSVVHSVAGNT